MPNGASRMEWNRSLTLQCVACASFHGASEWKSLFSFSSQCRRLDSRIKLEARPERKTLFMHAGTKAFATRI